MERIRECKKGDREYIEEMAKLIWEGDDYLPGVFNSWVEDGGFFVAEEDGRVIGTVKITILPEKVGWLEGLRVHPDYRGRGIGKRLNDFILDRAEELKKKGNIKDIEFSTYFKNVESLHITKKSGFRVIRGFYTMYREKDEEKNPPEEITLNRVDVKSYSDYLSNGWRFVRNTEEGFRWLRQRMKGYSSGDYKFYISGHEESAVILNRQKKAIRKYTEALNSLTEDEDSYSIFFPEEWDHLIEPLKESGYKFWEDDVGEPNIVILRYFS